MMAPKKSESGISRPRQKKDKGPGMMTFVFVAAGIVVVVVLALLLIGGGSKKKPVTRRANADSLGESGFTAKQKKTASTRASSVRAKKDEERAKLREERLQRKAEAKAGGSRTTRTSTGGFARGGAAAATSSPNELRAILTDNAGARTALVGERRLRAGDDVDGRRILEVSNDGVKVEYRENTYTVRIGQNVY
jgi:Sec-independent protein translocase protein TatA